MPIKMSRDWKLKRRTIKHPSFDEDESITIKSYYGDHDRQRVLSASTEYRREEESGAMYIVATLDKLHAIKRELAVVSWNLKDENGFPLPFTHEVLLNLPSEIASWLDDEINKDWDNLGEPLPSAEEAAAAAQQAKDDRATFQRAGAGLAPEQGTPDGRADDGAGENHSRRRHPQIAGS